MSDRALARFAGFIPRFVKRLPPNTVAPPAWQQPASAFFDAWPKLVTAAPKFHSWLGNASQMAKNTLNDVSREELA